MINEWRHQPQPQPASQSNSHMNHEIDIPQSVSVPPSRPPRPTTQLSIHRSIDCIISPDPPEPRVPETPKHRNAETPKPNGRANQLFVAAAAHASPPIHPSIHQSNLIYQGHPHYYHCCHHHIYYRPTCVLMCTLRV